MSFSIQFTAPTREVAALLVDEAYAPRDVKLLVKEALRSVPQYVPVSVKCNGHLHEDTPQSFGQNMTLLIEPIYFSNPTGKKN